jgi:hypothetical protein
MMWRRVLIWAFDLAIIFGVPAILLSVVYMLGVPYPVIAASIMPIVLAFLLIVLVYLPVRCSIRGNVVRVCAPVRCKEFEVLEWVEEVKRGLLPPASFTIAFGWRTLRFMAWSDSEYFFSTDKCDGVWRRARARSGGKEQTLWICCK